MKRIHLLELPSLLMLDLDSEIHVDEKYLDVSLISNWSADNEDDYKKFESLISDYNVIGEGYKITAWCDISGYNYWVLQENEPNYIQLSISFDNDSISEDDLSKIQDAICEAELYFIENVQSYY